MTIRALLAVGHGSRDPRHAASLHGLLDAVRRARPGVRTQLAFLDLSAPDVTAALARLAEAGARQVTVVPLFLGRGYHVRHDIPAVTARAVRALGSRRAPQLTIARQLGPDALVNAALEHRLREHGIDPGAPDLSILRISATTHSPADVIAEALRRGSGAQRIAVASHFLAPGLLHDRVIAVAKAAGVPVSAPLAVPDREPPAELVRLLLDRFAEGASVHEDAAAHVGPGASSSPALAAA